MNDILSFYGVFDDNKLVAVIGIEKNIISYLYVLKEYQNKGIGTKLIRLALEILKEYDTVLIDSVDSAKSFYKKMDFAIKIIKITI